MPGYPHEDCCPSSTGCGECDGNGTPDSLTVDVPTGVDEDCAGDCAFALGSYSIPRISGCTWRDTFAVSDPEFGSFCSRTADTLTVRATILSSNILDVTVIITDSTDIFGNGESWKYQLALSDPENCCAWSLLSVPFHSRFASGSNACDFSGTSVDVTASAGGC
jgi:hypothetical protein